MLPTSLFPSRFRASVQAIEQLQYHDRYVGAFIFGSLARLEATDKSDCDAIIIVNEDNLCTNINHPIIEGVKLDLTFLSLDQLKQRTQMEMEKRERVPMIAESLIIFDKTNQLLQVQEHAKQVYPGKTGADKYQFLHFMFFHGNDKVVRHLEDDPITALLVMHVGLNDFLYYHYQIHGRWWVSSKRLMSDLRQWDLPLAQLVEQFVTTCEVQTKFTYWSSIIDHILAPLGGRQPIAQNNCTCSTCQSDLAALLIGQKECHPLPLLTQIIGLTTSEQPPKSK